jgi:hypothetical protein
VRATVESNAATGAPAWTNQTGSRVVLHFAAASSPPPSSADADADAGADAGAGRETANGISPLLSSGSSPFRLAVTPGVADGFELQSNCGWGGSWVPARIVASLTTADSVTVEARSFINTVRKDRQKEPSEKTVRKSRQKRAVRKEPSEKSRQKEPVERAVRKCGRGALLHRHGQRRSGGCAGRVLPPLPAR